jgi:hypothetical protein
VLEQTDKIDIRDLPIDAIGTAFDSRKRTHPPTAEPELTPPPAVEVRTGADVFISYARENRSQADALARELSRRGWTVWWDRWIGLGRLFPKVIGRELAAAQCVVVLWSRRSVHSGWVLFEAMVGHSRNILIPIRLERVDLPVPFQELQTADLFGERYSEQLEECMKAVAAIVPPGPASKVDEIDSQPGSTAAGRGIFSSIRSLARVGMFTLLGVVFAALVAAAVSPRLVEGVFNLVAPPPLVLDSISPRIVPAPIPEIRVRQLTRRTEDPDHHPVDYSGALEIQVPPNAVVRVSAGLQRFVEGAVLVTDESGQLYQKWGTAAHHNLNTVRTLIPGQTFYIFSWHKEVADKGEGLPWHPSAQLLQQSNGSAKLTVMRQPGVGEVDAIVDVNVIGLAPRQRTQVR